MPTIIPYTFEEKKEKVVYFTSLVKNMKILVATEKPFAKEAVAGIREIVEQAGYELCLLNDLTNTCNSLFCKGLLSCYQYFHILD